jgi:hypothetical protein
MPHSGPGRQRYYEGDDQGALPLGKLLLNLAFYSFLSIDIASLCWHFFIV